MKTSEKITGTVVVGIFVGILVLGALGFNQMLLGPATEKMAQTERAFAVITDLEYRGDGSQISYRFWAGDRAWSGTTFTGRYPYLTKENATGKEIEVWFDPRNPRNSGAEKPHFMGWVIIIAPWAFVILFLGCYVGYLDGLWSWGIIRRKEK